MNVHYCPACNRGFFAEGNVGEMTQLPIHDRGGRGKDALPCENGKRRDKRPKAIVVRAPGAAV